MTSDNKIGIAIVLIVAIVSLCIGSAYSGYQFHQHEIKIDQSDYNYKQGQSVGEKICFDKGYKEGFEAGLKKSTDGYYIVRNPTYEEMKRFLLEDRTSDKKYNKDSYICTDFAAEVVNNAKEKGIRCASVYIIYPETGHSIIAFETTDRGMIFIEPQYDKEVQLKIGSSYSLTNGFLKQQDVDDTIVRYLIVW